MIHIGQAVLNLKYRGSAQKLFLNEQYDFSESAAAIVERLVPAFQSELAALPKPSGLVPVTLHCSGLPARQQWFHRSPWPWCGGFYDRPPKVEVATA